MLGYLKIAGAGLVVASLIFVGWKANGWRIKSAQAEVLQLELRNEMERRVKADADRLGLQVKLSEAEARIGSSVRIVTKTIRQYVQDSAQCRISGHVANSLRDLRAGVLPTAAPDAVATRAAP